MAALRGDRQTLVRGHDWYVEASRRSLPESPYGRVLRAAAMAWFGRAGLTVDRPIDLESVREGFALEPSGPAWLAALAVLLETWRDAGAVRAAAEGLALARSSHQAAVLGSRLTDGALAVEQALVEEAAGQDGAVESARLALMSLRPVGAGWWIARALRVLERAGAAKAEEVAEVAKIERRLGLVAPAA
jgi:hypothetical protein